VAWYIILLKVAPEVLEEKKEETAEQPTDEAKPSDDNLATDNKEEEI
jgi:hypothetical protein